MKVEYSSNNSGGDWWLSDTDWKELENAGWTVHWFKDNPDRLWSKPDAEGRWLGALATSAEREGLSLRDAITEWEIVTGLRASEAGCSCCGNPHSFSDENGIYNDVDYDDDYYW